MGKAVPVTVADRDAAQPELPGDLSENRLRAIVAEHLDEVVWMLAAMKG